MLFPVVARVAMDGQMHSLGKEVFGLVCVWIVAEEMRVKLVDHEDLAHPHDLLKPQAVS